MLFLNPPKLHQGCGVDIAPLAELKVLDGHNAAPPSEVEDKGAKVNVPPGLMILEDKETVFIRVRGAMLLGVVTAVLWLWGLDRGLAVPSLVAVVQGLLFVNEKRGKMKHIGYMDGDGE